jgi:3-oxoacyl-(acyl-carrier-protein) synthase
MSARLAKRIVVTGMGIVSPLGCGVTRMWDRLIRGGSGLRRIPEAIVPDIDAKVAGLAPAAIVYVNAHATSTAVGDAGEFRRWVS